ncbi:hypothetical protein ACLGI4_11700 [Streptomyces sp. HMX112]|uniref:hypothetical protein n=1 Tax=Streptomyces sp. HMX112 TaxID=3390850 RepID=UPI003A80EC64
MRDRQPLVVLFLEASYGFSMKVLVTFPFRVLCPVTTAIRALSRWQRLPVDSPYESAGHGTAAHGSGSGRGPGGFRWEDGER